jgi:uncharacterized membrane protein
VLFQSAERDFGQVARQFRVCTRCFRWRLFELLFEYNGKCEFQVPAGYRSALDVIADTDGTEAATRTVTDRAHRRSEAESL